MTRKSRQRAKERAEARADRHYGSGLRRVLDGELPPVEDVPPGEWTRGITEREEDCTPSNQQTPQKDP